MKNDSCMNEVKKSKKTSKRTGKENNRFLILHNDDYNSFDHVIRSLIEVCDHDAVQAEQCAYITHFNGKCDVKKGSYNLLKPLKDLLIQKELNVTID